MARGDHIFVHRMGYTHHGIDAGDGTVIHYTGEVGQKADAVIRRTRIDAFACGRPIQVRAYAAYDPLDVVVDRATSRLGETKYHFAFNNCEHFATWSKTGEHKSEQVTGATAAGGGAVGTGTAVAAGLGTVSATGAAAGLSGPGIMSGLATIGGAVGGGTVTGIVVVGVAPAVLATGAMIYVLKDDPILHQTEREARKAGRVATVASALGVTAASVGAVAAAGTVSGLSAAGVTSGLAAVGAMVGGAMTAGVLITAAAPAVAASAIGYGSYRLWNRLRKGRKEQAPG